MKYYLSTNAGELLCADAIHYDESESLAMKFYSWEAAYEYNKEFYNGELNEISSDDL